MMEGRAKMFGINSGKGITLVLACSIIFSLNTSEVKAKEYSEQELQETIEQIIDWKKSDVKQSTTTSLLSNSFLKNAGNSVVDWYPFAMGRVGYPDDYEAYKAIIEQNVEQRYKTKGHLSESKATEWHRISLAYLAAGGDAMNVGGHNLIADGVYNRGLTADLGVQGINGLVWGLITLDTLRYDVPKNAFESRKDIIKRIISLQLEDGGFSLDQKKSNIDLTAMTISALAPYYNSDEKFSYILKTANKKRVKSVREVIDDALIMLSSNQKNSGDFSSDGTSNLESTAQVAVALTSLHVNVEEDKRFIKKGRNIIDGLMAYENEDGGFIHAKIFNKDNPTSKPNQSNSMASEQALYAFVALYRAEMNERTLFDLRKPQTTKEKNAIYDAEKKIAQLKKSPAIVEQAFDAYKKVPIDERSYVTNYSLLERAVKKQHKKMALKSLTANQSLGEQTSEFPNYFNVQTVSSMMITKKDVELVKQLVAEPISTEQQVEIEKFRKLWQNAKNKERYKQLSVDILKRSEEITKKNDAIKELNEDILSSLYPFSKLEIKDEAKVKEILQKYNQLSSYDKKQVIRFEDVEKSLIQIKSLKRERLYKYTGITLAVSVIAVFILWKRQRRKKQGTSI